MGWIWTTIVMGITLLNSGKCSDMSRIRFTEVKSEPERPYFEEVGPRNVTTLEGHSVVLHCRVKHPADRTVSWIRKRDLHILTSSIHTYTGDGRFSVLHPEHSDDWDLHIEFVQKRDAGVYECQVNTEPKINMAVMLNVEDTTSVVTAYPGHTTQHLQDTQATIWGSADVYVKKGSTISLTCSVNVHGAPPSSVMWYHGPGVVDFDSQRGGISLETEKSESGTTSRLLITKAELSDSGNYTCMPSSAGPASVYVHVLIGENTAAMQRGVAPETRSKFTFFIALATIMIDLLAR